MGFIEELRLRLLTMKPRHIMFQLIKAEMTRRGHWKAKPRGKRWPKGYKVPS